MSEADPPSENRQSFENALKDVDEGRLSVRKACAKWGLAKSTLHDRVKGRWAKPGKGNPQVIYNSKGRRKTSFLVGRKRETWLWPVSSRILGFGENIRREGRARNTLHRKPTTAKMVSRISQEKPYGEVKECTAIRQETRKNIL